MTAANGRANGSALDNPRELVAPTVMPSAAMSSSTAPQFSVDQIKQLIAELEVPFDPAVIEWRVTNTTKSGKLRGQVIPYADPRAYTDRLNSLFTPAGWTRKYAVHTSANFERSTDQKTVAKVFVTCELTIFGLGSHSATGEEWTDDDNAGTSAEAQAFKRACACFGLGRYLYYFDGVWVDLDEPHPAQTNLGHHAFKTGTRDSPGRCPAQVIIHHFDLAPAQLPQAILHGVLQSLAFQIVIDLVHGRLTNVQHSLALQMLWLDFVTHALSPCRVGRSGFSGNVRAAVAPVAPRFVV